MVLIEPEENLFEKVAEISLVGIYLIQDNVFKYVNPKIAEILGYPVKELLGKKPSDVVHPSDRELVERNLKKRLNGIETSIHYSFRAVTKDKSVKILEVFGSRIIYKGKPGVAGTLIDITERKQYEEEISILLQALEQSPISMIMTDTHGRINYVNSKFTEFTGYTFEDVKGKDVSILGAEPFEGNNVLWETLKSGKVWRGEFKNKKKNGEIYSELSTISPIKNSKGEIVRYLAVKEDISERKQSEAALKMAKEKAEEMNRLKSIFLANMSHELRTPMIGILGYAESLFNELEKPEHKEMASTLLKSSNRLKDTLDSILDLSRLEANKMEVKLDKLNISDALTNIFKRYQKLADEKSLHLKIILHDTNVSSMLDKKMFNQVIENLLNNAIKFTDYGSITAELKRIIKNDNEFAEITITDTGVGIASESIQRVFEPFRQVSEGFARKYEGTGLGLTISKKFVELMNGEIIVESTPGKGSIFRIIFPAIKELPPVEDINIGQNKKTDASLPDVLLVENDLPTIGIIKLYLENYYNVDFAKDGATAVSMTKEKKYDIILMDIDLGVGIDGLQTAKIIKELPGYNSTPIVAVTAYAMAGDREKFLAGGCTHYISKPFDKKALLSFLGQIKK